MREMLFHGKKTVTGEWVEGSLLITNSTMGKLFWIVDEFGVEFGVRARTIGQYTGLTDKNGKKIFEGDIVRIYPCIVDETIVKQVIFDDSLFGVLHSRTMIPLRAWDDSQFEVIGNIHDNPELIEDKPHD